jgi:hypothetical protein
VRIIVKALNVFVEVVSLISETMRVTVEAMRVLLEAMNVFIEAVSMIIEAVRLKKMPLKKARAKKLCEFRFFSFLCIFSWFFAFNFC